MDLTKNNTKESDKYDAVQAYIDEIYLKDNKKSCPHKVINTQQPADMWPMTAAPVSTTLHKTFTNFFVKFLSFFEAIYPSDVIKLLTYIKRALCNRFNKLKPLYLIPAATLLLFFSYLIYSDYFIIDINIRKFEARLKYFFYAVSHNCITVANLTDFSRVTALRGEPFITSLNSTPKLLSHFNMCYLKALRLLNDFFIGVSALCNILFIPINNPLYADLSIYVFNIFSGLRLPEHNLGGNESHDSILYLNNINSQTLLFKIIFQFEKLINYDIFQDITNFCAYLFYSKLQQPDTLFFTTSNTPVNMQFFDTCSKLFTVSTRNELASAVWYINEAFLYDTNFSALFDYHFYLYLANVMFIISTNFIIFGILFTIKFLYFFALITFFVVNPIVSSFVFPITMLLTIIFELITVMQLDRLPKAFVAYIVHPAMISAKYNLIGSSLAQFLFMSALKLIVSFKFFTPFIGLLFYIVIMFILSFSTFFFGTRGVYTLSTCAVALCWLIQIFFVKRVFCNNLTWYYHSPLNIRLFDNINFNLSLKLDAISVSFLFLTTTIGFAATVYSLTYFKNEPHADRFIIILNWFIISMSLLVIADNAIILFLGWELIGLTSFLLINFWTLRRGTIKSAIKALTFNKVSDVSLLLFIIWMALLTGTADITVWIETIKIIKPLPHNSHELLCILLIVASSIKSAQLIAHLWLPDSMEAPIPASALIHSATLVSAGVYLLLRFQFMLIDSFSIVFVGLLGSITAVYGSIVSSSQTDAKKLLAYSTISHCGFLFVTIYLLNVELTLLYLYLHGLFKALTFFCVGNLVKVAKGHQDTRKMGQFMNLLPIESILLIMCCVNLGGLPFTVGFYYKHFFQVLLTQNAMFSAIAPLLLIAMLLGVVYSYRLINYSLFDIKKSTETVYLQVSSKLTKLEQYTNSTKLSILSILSLFIFSIIYFYGLFSFQKSFHSTNLFSQQLANNELFFSTVNSTLSIGFITIFCKLFIVVILMLCLYVTRSEFTNITKKHFNLYTLLFILFFCL